MNYIRVHHVFTFFLFLFRIISRVSVFLSDTSAVLPSETSLEFKEEKNFIFGDFLCSCLSIRCYS